MRIFLAGIGMQPGPWGKGLWTINLRDPLVDLGHELVESAVNWDRGLPGHPDAESQERRAKDSQQLLDEVKAAHRQKPLNLFFSYFYNNNVVPGVIREIRRAGIPTVNFFCNAAHQFHLVREIAPAYDYCWVPERIAIPYYRAAGANPLHIQMGANPSVYRPLPNCQRDLPVSFMGMLYSDRAQWLARMHRHGIPLRVFTGRANSGSGDPVDVAPRSRVAEALADLRNNGPMYLARRTVRYWSSRRALRQLEPVFAPPVADQVELFNRSEAVLNLSHVYDGGGPGGQVKAHIRLREFEAPLCRTLFCPQWCDELELYYDLEREVLCWRSVEELQSKLKHYLSNSSDAEKVREAGYRRATGEHTAHHRFRQLFQATRLVSSDSQTYSLGG